MVLQARGYKGKYKGRENSPENPKGGEIGHGWGSGFSSRSLVGTPQPHSKPDFAAHQRDEEDKNWLRTGAGQKKQKWELLFHPPKKKTTHPFLANGAVLPGICWHFWNLLENIFEMPVRMLSLSDPGFTVNTS